MARNKSTMFNHLPFRFIDSTLKVPSAPEAERGVLGLMLDSETAQDAAFQKLTLESFPNDGNDHRSIFKAMLNLREQKTTIDLVTLTTELTRMGALERVGGFEYLNELANLSFLYSSLDDYIKQINDQSLLRVLYSVIDEAINRYRRNDIDNINDFVGQLSNRINEVAQERRIADFKSLQDIGKEFISKMEAMKESGTGTLTGVNTGYAGLNNLTHGFQKGDLVIVAARPSMGKTAFALNLALNVAQDPHHQHVVGFFSCEMNSHLLMLRLVAMAANVRSDKIQRNTLDKNERIKVSEAINTLRTRRIYIDDTSNININDLIIKARKLKNEQPDLSVIFIDYLGLITTTGKQESRQLEIQKITQQLKELARSLEVTVVCLAQLNRGVEDRDNKVPILSDLRESGSIEQDADVVMLLNREDVYLMNKTLKKEKARYYAYYEETKEQETNDKTGKFLSPSIIDIYIAKNRNGQTGIETLVFFKSSFLISNPDKTLQVRIREMQRGTESPTIMEYIVLASGSKGNATILRSKNGIILIDLGITLTQFEKRARPFNISLDDVDAIFYTHNHGDHFKPFAKLDELALYATKEVAPTFSINEINPYDELEIVGFKIKVIPLSHDANNTVGFIIEDEEDKLVYITDTGYLSEYNIKQASNATYYIFESNHDPELLLDTDRPFELKMRILSDNGHLSNEDSANYLCQMIGNRTKEVVLAHLSEEANTKELALNTFIKVAESKNINLNNIKVKAARQHRAISGGSL